MLVRVIEVLLRGGGFFAAMFAGAAFGRLDHLAVIAALAASVVLFAAASCLEETRTIRKTWSNGERARNNVPE